MKKRIITGAILLAIFVPLIMLDHLKYPPVGTLFLILGVFLSMVAAYEMMNVFSTKYPTLKNYRFIMGLFSGLLVLAIHYSPILFERVNFSVEILLLLLILLLIMLFSIFTKTSSAHEIMACLLTICYCGLMFGYVINIRYLEPFPAGESLIYLRGGRSFGYLYSIVLATDTCAYLFGTKFGKRRLAPEISPKKSVEGAIAGLLGGSVIGVLVIFLLDISNHSNSKELMLVIIIGFFLSMFISFMVQIGDLVASKIKRTFEVSDFGTILPGHGGIIDRFDSLIYAGVAYYIIVQVLQIILVN